MSFQFSGSCILFTTARVLATAAFRQRISNVHTSKIIFNQAPDDIFPSSSYIIIRLRRKASMHTLTAAKCNRSYVKRILFTSVTVALLYTPIFTPWQRNFGYEPERKMIYRCGPMRFQDIRFFTPKWQRRLDTDTQQKYPVRILTSFSNCLSLAAEVVF